MCGPSGQTVGQPDPKRIRRFRLLTVGVVVLGAVALVALAETAAWMLTSSNDSKWNVRLGANRRFDPLTQFRNTADYVLPDGTVTNEQGFLAPRNLTLEKPPGVLRLIYLGDSVTFLPAAGNYPAQVEALLEARGVRVQTVNTAVPGFASHNARALFESEVSQYEADALVVYLGWNDLGQYGPEGLPYKRLEKGYELSPLQQLIARTYSLRLLYQLQRMRRHAEPAGNDELSPTEQQLYAGYSPDHYRDNLRAIVRLGKSRYPHVYLATLATITSDDPTPEELARAHFPVGMSKNMRKLDRLVAA